MRLKDFLRENTEKHAVLAFGRFNPPTIGHGAVVDKVKKIAQQNNASHHVVLSHTQDKAKNPLSAAQKLKHAKRMFPGTNFSTSNSEAPNFLTQAQKLHQSGVTHLHMVAGSDRIPEYKKILKKYNGGHEGALFNFKHIEVHSAGERDPDAEGVTGMSASKMRSHATSGNFNEFRKGLPSHAKDSHARDLYNDVRRGMNINEAFAEEVLQEGVHDKGIFKAVFLAGGPGSGKDYVMNNTLTGHGLVEINSDKAFEYLMDREGLDKTMPDSEEKTRDQWRKKAKSVTELRERLALMGRNGVIINGTGDDYEKISKIKAKLEELGYDTNMLMVNTRDDVSQARNIERGQSGGRTVPEDIRKKKWDSVQASRPEFAKMFGSNYREIDNSEDLRTAPEDVKQAKKDEMLDIFTKMKEFVESPPTSEKSQEWVARELQKKDRLPIPKDGAPQAPHKDSGTAEEARKLGLNYYGFGRYGKNGEVTHRSVHDKLVQVNKSENKMRPKQPVKESIDEAFTGFLSEAVSVTITGDTPDEVSDMMSRLKSKLGIKETKYGLSDRNEAMTLGANFAPVGVRAENMVITNDDMQTIMHESKKKEEPDTYLMSNGKPRIFVMRTAAAAVAHNKNGKVVQNKDGKGYLVKLNEENYNVSVVEKSIQEERSGGRGTSGTSGTGTREETFLSEQAIHQTSTKNSGVKQDTAKAISEETKAKKLQFQQFKTKIIESIDKGIEPGMSMAAGGESGGRDMGEKIDKKGRANPVNETGGEAMVTSMSDQKENELRRQGITLSTFKAKRPV